MLYLERNIETLKISGFWGDFTLREIAYRQPSVILIILTHLGRPQRWAQLPKGFEGKHMEKWLDSLITNTPQEGFELAIKLARMGVKYTQPSAQIREELRGKYEKDADSLTFASQVVAVHYQTIAAANNYWRPVGRD